MSRFAAPSKLSIHSYPWKPTLPEQRAYNYLFSLVDAHHTGIVSRNDALHFLERSGVSETDLSKILRLAGADSNEEQLTRREFRLVLKLISLAQSSKPISLYRLCDQTPLPRIAGVTLPKEPLWSPQSLPQVTTDWDSLIASANNFTNQVAIGAEERAEYIRQFACCQHMSDEMVDRATVEALIPKSRPSVEQCDRIWRLVDAGDTGSIDVCGFVVFMYYLRRATVNRTMPLPPVCPPTLWESAGGQSPPITPPPPPPPPPSQLLLPENLSPVVSEPETENSTVPSSQLLSPKGNVSTPKSPVVGDAEVTALLSQIDQMVDPSSPHDSETEAHLVDTSLRRHRLENELAVLRSVYEKESKVNKELAEKLHTEEATVDALQLQIKRASDRISRISTQRNQLIQRIEHVETQQLELHQILVHTQYEAQRLSSDVSSFDHKVRNLEKNMSSVRRQVERQGSGHGSSGQSANEETVTPRRSDTVWRGRLSGLFRKASIY